MAHINIAYVKNQPTPLYRVLSSKMVALLRVIFARWTKQRGQFKSSLPSFPFTIIMLLFCISSVSESSVRTKCYASSSKNVPHC